MSVVTQLWGDAFLLELKHYIATACEERTLPDIDFFLNKRDHPLLSSSLHEPYGFLYASRDAVPPLTRERHDKYVPIMSFYTSEEHADLRFPCQVPCPVYDRLPLRGGGTRPLLRVPLCRAGRLAARNRACLSPCSCGALHTRQTRTVHRALRACLSVCVVL